MSTDPAGRISPLDHFMRTTGVAAPGRSAGVVISERPFLGHLNLRGDSSDGAFADGVERALGLSLPVQPNAVSYGDGKQALWLGPDEWLIVTPPDEQDAVADALVEEPFRVCSHRLPTSRAGRRSSPCQVRTRSRCWPRAARWTCTPGPSVRGQMRPDPRRRGGRHPAVGESRAVIRPHSPPQLRRVPGAMAPRRRFGVRHCSRMKTTPYFEERVLRKRPYTISF